MPAPPELRNGTGDVRVVEVFKEVEAEYAAKANGHVAVTGEIEVYLKRVAYGGQPIGSAPRAARRIDILRNCGDVVRNEHLFRKTQNEPAHPADSFFPALAPERYLALDSLVADDRPGYELREQADVQREAEIALLYADLFPIQVDKIGKYLKGVEAYADWQGNIPHLQRDTVYPVEIFNKEVEIFEHCETAEQEDERCYQKRARYPPLFFEAVYAETTQPCDERRRQHQKHVLWLAPRIEHERRDEQHGVAPCAVVYDEV